MDLPVTTAPKPAWQMRLSDYMAAAGCSRSFSLGLAKIDDYDHPDTQALVALANLRKGETFSLGARKYQVVSTGKKVVIIGEQGRRVVLDLFSDRFQRFWRDAAGQIIFESQDRHWSRFVRPCGDAPVFPLLDALGRDAAYQYREQVRQALQAGCPVDQVVLRDAGLAE